VVGLSTAAGIMVAAVVLALVTDHLWIMFVPLGLLFGLIVLVQVEVAFYLLVVMVPFSQELLIPGTGAALQFPTEPLLIATVLIWVAMRYLRPKPQTAITGGPGERIDLFVILLLLSLGLSVLTSTDHVTSAKKFVNTLWYVLFCYFFVRKELVSSAKVTAVVRIFLVMASVAALYSLLRAAFTGFSPEGTNVSSRPLFPERGSYASYLSIVLGIALGVMFGVRGNRNLFVGALGTCILAAGGVVFSYTRAAWLGVGVLLLFFIVVKAKEFLKPKTFILFVFVTAILIAPIYFVGVQAPLERNLNSMTNVESNLSNLERINRWVAAVNIIKANPVLGVGYGTYAEQYEIYRDRKLETPVSNFHGSAHNDYLQFWAEAGIPGFVSWILLIGAFVIAGVMWYYRIQDVFLRNVLLGCTGGVLTYLVHGFFNTFLHFDKVAVPFWVTMALAVVIIDLGAASGAGKAFKQVRAG
jgi:O-antigen ligase